MVIDISLFFNKNVTSSYDKPELSILVQIVQNPICGSFRNLTKMLYGKAAMEGHTGRLGTWPEPLISTKPIRIDSAPVEVRTPTLAYHRVMYPSGWRVARDTTEFNRLNHLKPAPTEPEVRKLLGCLHFERFHVHIHLNRP